MKKISLKQLIDLNLFWFALNFHWTAFLVTITCDPDFYNYFSYLCPIRIDRKERWNYKRSLKNFFDFARPSQ